jgi:hypothetical protein
MNLIHSLQIFSQEPTCRFTWPDRSPLALVSAVANGAVGRVGLGEEEQRVVESAKTEEATSTQFQQIR